MIQEEFSHKTENSYDNDEGKGVTAYVIDSIIGSKTYGVAKAVELVAVKISRHSKVSISSIILGYEFAVSSHKPKLRSKDKGFKDSRMNVSLGGYDSKALDMATEAITAAGLHVASVPLTLDSMSGTSMSTPHVAGLLSYYLSLFPEPESEFAVASLDPQTLKSKVLKYATKGALHGLLGSPNLLAYNGAGRNLSEFWNL
ncbi:hypothetical protein G9P44_005667 [Scheffersomyces stipitis]|nr:hypothetical protein G9P44_005667 [Scheffersomyces stipitis]